MSCPSRLTGPYSSIQASVDHQVPRGRPGNHGSQLLVRTWAASYISSAVFRSWQELVFECRLRGDPLTVAQYVAEQRKRLVAAEEAGPRCLVVSARSRRMIGFSFRPCMAVMITRWKVSRSSSQTIRASWPLAAIPNLPWSRVIRSIMSAPRRIGSS